MKSTNILAFYALTILNCFLMLQANGPPFTPAECAFCKEPIQKAEGQSSKAAMLKHLEGCEKLVPEIEVNGKEESEENKEDEKAKECDENKEKLEQMMKEFAKTTKELDEEFKQNVVEHFPRLVVEMDKLCKQYCALELNKFKSESDEEKDTKSGEEGMVNKIMALEKRVEKLMEKIAKSADQQPSAVAKKGKMQTKMVGKKAAGTKPAARGGANLNVQPWGRGSNMMGGEKRGQMDIGRKLLNKKMARIEGGEDDVTKKERRLAKLHAGTMLICRDAVGRFCSVEERIRLLDAGIDDMEIRDFLEKVLPLAQELRENAEQLWDEAINYRMNKMDKNAENEESSAEHLDTNYVTTTAHRLHKLRLRLVNVYALLNNNFDVLTWAHREVVSKPKSTQHHLDYFSVIYKQIKKKIFFNSIYFMIYEYKMIFLNLIFHYFILIYHKINRIKI